MAALSRSDAERLLRFLADAESIDGDQPFTPELLVDLGRLIEADGVVYHEADQLHQRVLTYVLRPGDDDDEGGDTDGDWDWESMKDHRLPAVEERRMLRRSPALGCDYPA